MQYDVVIIGGGPAGICLGNLLRRTSVSCCIVDRAKFPRDKLCGGLVTGKTMSRICGIFKELSLESIGGFVTNEVLIYYNNELISDIRADIDFLLVDRIRFDNELVNQYRKAGGILFDNCPVAEIDYDKSCVLLKDGRKIYYKVLVGADGVYSRVRKYMDAGYKPGGFCIEISVDKKALDFMGSGMHVYLGAIRHGYGWVFPKRDKYVVGFGGLIKYNKGNYLELFKKFCRQIGLEDDNYKAEGMHIPFGGYVRVPIRNNVLLIGDAAGFVDPITGEGLYYAALSAEIAFETISAFFDRSGKLSDYSVKILKIQQAIDSTLKTQRFFYRNGVQKIGFSLARGHKGFVKYICDNVLSTDKFTYHNAFKTYFLHKLGL